MIDLTPWQIWMSAGILLFIFEVFTPGFLLASLGGGALFASLAAYFHFSLTWQIAFFALGTAAVFVGVRPFVLRWLEVSDLVPIGKEAMLGKAAEVTELIGGGLAKGRISYAGETWMAQSESSHEVGALVVINKIDGLTLWVESK